MNGTNFSAFIEWLPWQLRLWLNHSFATRYITYFRIFLLTDTSLFFYSCSSLHQSTALTLHTPLCFSFAGLWLSCRRYSQENFSCYRKNKCVVVSLFGMIIQMVHTNNNTLAFWSTLSSSPYWVTYAVVVSDSWQDQLKSPTMYQNFYWSLLWTYLFFVNVR